MLHINKVKTFYGLKWAVTEVNISVDEKGKKTVNVSPVEYHGSSKRDIRVAIFPLTDEGLEKAREIRGRLNKNKK